MAALAAPAAALVGSAAIEGRVLAPGSDGEGWWDQRTSAMPIVLPPSAHRKRWRMFYYGREDGNWNGGRPAFLPTGVSGLAESDDGLRWTRVRGPLEGGAVLRPPDDPAAFDHVHLGMTDVVEDAKDGSYTALFFGGSAEEVNLGMGPGPIVGFKMRPGAATSADGLQWLRHAGRDGGVPLLDVGAPGEWDSNFVSWPRALPVQNDKPDGAWCMTYHALQPPASDGAPPTWAVGAAFSESGPLGPWVKSGRVLSGGDEGAWDCRGIGTRHVVRSPRDPSEMVMIYEGVGNDGKHRLGLATSSDGGASWGKYEGAGMREPGGPVFECGAEGAWDDGNVGTPWLTCLPEGGYRLYYVGTSDTGRTVAIGAADSPDLFSCEWKRVDGAC